MKLPANSMLAVVDTLKMIAEGREGDPRKLAASVLRQLEGEIGADAINDFAFYLGVQEPPPRFHAPLVRSISTPKSKEFYNRFTDSIEFLTEIPDGAIFPAEVPANNVTGPVPKSLVRTRSRTLEEKASEVVAADNTFTIEVFSVDDACNKEIDCVRPDDTLALIVDKIKFEFALSGCDKLLLAWDDRPRALIDRNQLRCTLSSLGIKEGTQLSYSLQTMVPFELTVSTITGTMVTVSDLQGDMNLATLINAVECELSLDGGEAVQLVLGDRTFDEASEPMRLDELGIVADCELIAMLKTRNKGSCPSCRREFHIRRNVTIGAIHDSWGRRWNKCNYDCMHCSIAIKPGMPVAVCMQCKCFWHENCRIGKLASMNRDGLAGLTNTEIIHGSPDGTAGAADALIWGR
jgi:hypothetical protein